MTIRTGFLIGSFLAATVALAQSPPTLPPPRALPGTLTPPETTKLKAELDALKKERERFDPGEDPADAKRKADRIHFRIQLLDLLKQLQNRPVATPPPAVKKSAEPAPAVSVKSETVSGDVDQVKAALNLYRSGQIDAAHRKFAGLKLDDLSREDKAFVKYMTACCLRRMGKYADAMELYREVADEKADSFLAENAVWQISVIKSTVELESQLEQLRPRKNSYSK